MQAVDPDGDFKVYMKETKQWEKCLELAQKEVIIFLYPCFTIVIPSFYDVLLC